MNELLDTWLETTDNYYIDFYTSIEEFVIKLYEYKENNNLDGTQFEQYCENDLDVAISGIML